mmetsp:Transcript_11786/g.53189  ORF Transcript_11786/g.53189 Transcript_11786/m.53189 type:complete len:250 (+) Transcript_11786:1220-1969(+)
MGNPSRLTRFKNAPGPFALSSSSVVRSPPEVRVQDDGAARQRPVRPRQLRLLALDDLHSAFRTPRAHRLRRARMREHRVVWQRQDVRRVSRNQHGRVPHPVRLRRLAPVQARQRPLQHRASRVRRHEPDVRRPGERALEVEPAGAGQVHLVHQKERRFLHRFVQGSRRDGALAQRGPQRVGARGVGPVPDADEVVVRGVAPARHVEDVASLDALALAFARETPEEHRPDVRPAHAHRGAHDRGDLAPAR